MKPKNNLKEEMNNLELGESPLNCSNFIPIFAHKWPNNASLDPLPSQFLTKVV